MKPKTILLTLTLTLALTGCKTAGVYDPVRTDQVVAATTPLVAGGIYRVIHNNTNRAAELSLYFRAVGSVFCDMEASREFSPNQVLTAINNATMGLQVGADQNIIYLKDSILTMYAVFWGDRFHAELDAEKWPIRVAQVLCNGIDTGLKDAGQTGVK